jgi:transcriptional regulator with XRE-family HTH domain
MTRAQLKKARHALGLSAEGFARLVGVKSGRTVRRWESGEREIPGPVTTFLQHVKQRKDGSYYVMFSIAGENIIIQSAAEKAEHDKARLSHFGVASTDRSVKIKLR